MLKQQNLQRIRLCDMDKCPLSFRILGKQIIIIQTGGINIMENYLGEFWIFKIACLAAAAYLVYFFIKDRMRKK